jgi:hypothetical protein
MATLVQGRIFNAQIVRNTNTKVTAGKAGEQSIVKDSAGIQYIIWDGEISANIATTVGAGGLMTGQVEAPNTWYQVVAMADSSEVNPVAIMFVPAGVAPAEAGYDRFRRIGWVRNDGSSHFLEFTQVGIGTRRRYWYQEANSLLEALSDGAATAWTAVDLSALVPPTARDFVGLVRFKAGVGGAAADEFHWRIAGAASMNIPIGFGVAEDTKGTQLMPMSCDASQQVEYEGDNAANRSDLLVMAFDDEV